ncbi:ABC transporter permease [Nesterenkonia populi]
MSQTAEQRREPEQPSGTDQAAAPTAASAEGGVTLKSRSLAERLDAVRWLTAPVAAVVIALAGWQLLSVFSDGWVPGIGQIVERSDNVWSGNDVIGDTLTTLRRIFTVFLFTVILGTIIGVAAGFSRRLRAFLRPILTIALAIPDLVYIIMIILVLGLAESSGLTALVLAICPLVVNVVMNATIDRNKSLDEMAKTYRFSLGTYAAQVLWYQLKPAIHAGTRTAFAFSWKLMVLLEGLTQNTGIGAAIMDHFDFRRVPEMIVLAVYFTILMKLIEVLIIDRLFDDRRVQKKQGVPQ